MRWRYATVKAARTFFQTAAGSLAAVQLVFDASFTKGVAQALAGAGFAAVISFCMNVSPTE